MNLITRAGVGALGAAGLLVAVATPAGATEYAASRDCDGEVTLTSSGVGTDTTGTFEAAGQTWQLGPGASTTVPLGRLEGATVRVYVVFAMADGVTWDEERQVPVLDETCPPETTEPSPETVAPPVTTTPPSVVPPGEPAPSDPPASPGPTPTLPSTGVGPEVLASAGAALLAAGGGLTLLARRRAS